MPAEVIENISPVIMHKSELREDSEGAGRRRGGFGQEMEIGVRGNSSWTPSAMYDRTRCPALGLRGGSSGALGAVRTASREPLHPKRQQRLEGSERVILSLPGGGFGAATEREPEMVSRDVTDGLVSIERARDVYKVVLDGDRSGHYTVDADATARLRAEAVSRSDDSP